MDDLNWQSFQPTSGPLLATDLDGTLIPLEGHDQNSVDLATLRMELKRADCRLVFVTGRHLTSVQQAINEFELPSPDAIICDVGSSIYRIGRASQPVLEESYTQHLREIAYSLPIGKLRELLKVILELQLQEEDKQGAFKLSYYAEAATIDDTARRVQDVLDRVAAPYNMISSVDPFNGDGLIDLLPKGVTKSYALRWWIDQHAISEESVVFAGDSGNDLAVLTAGYRAIVVGNANRLIAKQAQQAHEDAGWKDRLHLANAVATSGVLEGCRKFGLFV